MAKMITDAEDIEWVPSGPGEWSTIVDYDYDNTTYPYGDICYFREYRKGHRFVVWLHSTDSDAYRLGAFASKNQAAIAYFGARVIFAGKSQ